ncbi:hypothetical protein BZA05DRAFT_437841 [Tricharina praecox]|uniref:uncharacterized protein n=1 Tax=Tricharina praecox TaxID=43433 RepID=UPI00221E3DD0|nr:uncharacterized protein BZA05DRAFT_437841 [Tricharina praecox]KAI5847465.1 hypothetical protein BZA05DRAFT_437841 [Tricharina praecox]
MSGHNHNLQKRATKAATTVKPARNSPKIPKAASGISKSARAKKYIYALKPTTMARLADIEFDEHTTLVEGARFYLQPGGRKRAPSGVVAMVITVPAGVEGQWPVWMDFKEEVLGEAEEKEVEQQLQQQPENEQLEEEQQAEAEEEERPAGNTSRLSCIVM